MQYLQRLRALRKQRWLLFYSPVRTNTDLIQNNTDQYRHKIKGERRAILRLIHSGKEQNARFEAGWWPNRAFLFGESKDNIGTTEDTARISERRIIDMKNHTEITVENQRLSAEVRFYTISDLVEMTGWSEVTVQKLFNDPNFPSTDFGRCKIVEAHALIEYFSTKHMKSRERYWRT